MMGDPNVQEHFRTLGDDPKRNTVMYADAVNAAIRDVPPDMTVCVHTCRGNFKSTFLASGGYDFVADTAFSRLDVDGFFLEYDTERAGGFEPLRFIPKGQEGCPRSRQFEISGSGEKGRFKTANRSGEPNIPLENLCISPQCGFSSTFHGNIMTIEQQAAKLRLCVETATEVWGSL